MSSSVAASSSIAGPVRPQRADDLESGVSLDQSQPAPFNGLQSGNRNCGCHCSSVPSLLSRRRSFPSDSSAPASIASSTASLSDGPPLGPVPSGLGHLFRAMFWIRLHRPPFSDVPGSPELISNPGNWRRTWLAHGYNVIKVFLKFGEDEITHPGCARIPTKQMIEKVRNEYDHSPEVVHRSLYERRKSVDQGPEITSRPRLFDKTLPIEFEYAPAEAQHPKDVDGNFLINCGRNMDEFGHPPDEYGSGQDPYLVIGVFAKDETEPYERLVRLGDDMKFFNVLHREVKALRGWKRFLSLKSLSGFGLYRCDLKHYDRHYHVNLSRENKRMLRKLAIAYKFHGDSFMRNSIEWHQWVCVKLNGSRHDPTKPGKHGGYSLSCQFRWSRKRITFAVLSPLLGSIVAGIWYQQVTGDVQTAWGIASYIMTAAALFVALLGVNGQLAGL